MSTIQRTKRKTSRFRWTPERFQKAAEEGWFGDRKVELLMTRHASIVKLYRFLVCSHAGRIRYQNGR